MKEPQKDWEKEFDERFLSGHHWKMPEGQGNGKDFANNSIKPFILNLLSTTRKETIEECIGVLEGEKIICHEGNWQMSCVKCIEARHHNQALTTAIAKLNKLKARE